MTAITQDNIAPGKAGAVISGVRSDTFDGKEYVVAPYTEGRFGTNDKYHVLAKGSIDEGENVLDAAIREASEETGINIGQTFNSDGTWDKKPYLLSAEQIERLRKGEVIANEPSGYEDVHIRKVAPEALDYVYDGRESKPHRVVMLNIEVEGIDKLYPHLKNPDNRSEIGKIAPVRLPLRDRIRGVDYPRFDEILNWLRTMKTPDAPWAKPKAKSAKNIAREALAPKRDASGKFPAWFDVANQPGYFAGLEATFKAKTGKEIIYEASWQNFLKMLQQEMPEDYANILQLAELVKDKLSECGVIKSDSDLIKFDTKDLPLFFYQEGADILTKEQYLKSCIDNAIKRGDFARAFAGNTRNSEDKNTLSRIARIEKSQLAGVVWAVGEENIATVVDHLIEELKPETEQQVIWGQPLYEPAHFKALGDDLRDVYKKMKAKEVPLEKVANIVPKGKVAADPPRQQQGAA
ncbi:MAG: NUDIX domain-containing protein [Rickettsiales bacterium]|nr:NUDIX domain-containing protein [Rickettsiales bacterium]